MHVARVILTGRANMEVSESDDGEVLIRFRRWDHHGMTIFPATIASDVRARVCTVGQDF